MQMNSCTEGRRDRIQLLDKRVLIPFRGTHWQVDGEGRLCVGEELVLPPLMGRGGAMPSNISSPRYLPVLVVSLSMGRGRRSPLNSLPHGMAWGDGHPPQTLPLMMTERSVEIAFFGDDGDEEFERVSGWVQFTDSPVKT